MRAGAIAAGLVAVALAGSLGLVFAQKGDLTALPWGKLKGDAATAGSSSAATEPAAAQRGARDDAMVVAQNTPRAAPQQTAAAQPAAASSLPAPLPAAASVVKGPPCTNPDALGVSRVPESGLRLHPPATIPSKSKTTNARAIHEARRNPRVFCDVIL